MKARAGGIALSRDYLIECFSYDKESGEVRWKSRPVDHFFSESNAKGFSTKFGGKIVEETSRGGVKLESPKVNLGGVHYTLSSIIYYIVTGFNPQAVSFIDGNPRNLKLDNLHACTECQMYWMSMNSAKITKPSFNKRDKTYKVATKFNQISHRKLFKCIKYAEIFSYDVFREVRKSIISQSFDQISDENTISVLRHLYEKN